MKAADLPVPDLLRRFSAAPHCSTGCLQDIEVTLHTNDFEFVSALRGVRHSSASAGLKPALFLKLIRDCDSPVGISEPMVLSAWPLTTLLLGAGTVLTLDCQRREILGFVAPGVSADRVVHELLPILLEYLHTDQPHVPCASVTGGL